MLDYNTNYELFAQIFGTEQARAIREKSHIIRDCDAAEPLFLKDSKLKKDISYRNDFVRYRTFELCVRELKKANISGSCAELGVYKGQFAQYISAAFPDRELYLYDTFEGFQESDLDKSVSSTWTNVFKDTSVDMVLSLMTDQNNVVIRKGYFPQTIREEENSVFAFVSIDADLEKPIYDGLEFFYPRLSKGGYIFVHDYNGGKWHGIERAVRSYEEKLGQALCKVPICDSEGTLVITKN